MNYIIYLLFSCRVDEQVAMMMGMFLYAFSFFVLLPMANEPPKVISISSELLFEDKCMIST